MSADEPIPQDGIDEFFRLNRATTALLVIDMQNAFIDERIAPSFALPGARSIIPKVRDLLLLARRLGLLVIWTRSDHQPPFGGVMLTKFPKIRDERVLWMGEETADFYADMTQPIAGEIIITKHKYDAFFETDLESALRNRSIRTLVITGVATNICCESTARSAFMRDYRVSFVSDGTATFNERMHQATLEVIRLFFGRVMTSGEVSSELTEETHRADRVA